MYGVPPDCLRTPTKVDTRIIVTIYCIYVCVWVFMYFEAYGLRLRRQICCFFYRKREKKRVLYMYNDMLKKRKGFLRQMRHRVRKQVKAGTLTRPTGVFSALLQEFPRCCKFLERFNKIKIKCLICEDPKDNDFHKCETEGCNFTYCKDCWLDVKKKCYACQQPQAGSYTDSVSATDDDSDITDDDIFD
ncbi:E3 ubiquitin-protein ligase DCST1-like [Haliotis asinina]|uniref:E3 ubiquitin-protein ligase DCST1-like n=1 Tax=Haliotis asinina TaxID=109174 RepID=UPI003532563D